RIAGVEEENLLTSDLCQIPLQFPVGYRGQVNVISVVVVRQECVMLIGGDPVTGKEHHGYIMFGDGMHYPVEAPENRILRRLAVPQSLVLRIQNDFFL